ncbi:hypothetical protein MHSWG343_06650 [Candidatus Mycoplasma haematohominis]|uniref:Uncharacterized protein n=1 Tax=Candidatus Mycoplasma haematohominis TaxID=1494318 RepID=A0A478FU96_9MOLU|nr:hypothetical protein MHSWG343_06650 [Candidatus Mycoplasma haemohominis]
MTNLSIAGIAVLAIGAVAIGVYQGTKEDKEAIALKRIERKSALNRRYTYLREHEWPQEFLQYCDTYQKMSQLGFLSEKDCLNAQVEKYKPDRDTWLKQELDKEEHNI